MPDLEEVGERAVQIVWGDLAYVQNVLNRVERLLSEGLDPDAIPSLFIGPKPQLAPIR